MPKVAVEAPVASEQLVAAVKPVGEHIITACKDDPDKQTQTSVVFMVFDKQGSQLYSDKVEKAPAMMLRVSSSKARSFLAGKTLQNPTGMNLMCCFFLPWMCGCTNQMQVRGVAALEIEGEPSVAGAVVAGAPKGDKDLQLLESSLKANGFSRSDNGTWTKK